jgi:predicted RNase H-like HicB family nuclease
VPQAILLVVKSPKLLDHYIEAALKTARYEKIENGTRVYTHLPDFPGAWADGNTRDEASKSLHQVLRGWIELQLERGHSLPKLKRVETPQLSLA